MFWENPASRGPLNDIFGAGQAVSGVAQAAGGIAAAGIQAAAAKSAANSEADAAKYASDQQYKAANDATTLQGKEFDQQQENQQPYLDAGKYGLKLLGHGIDTGWTQAYGQTFNTPTSFSSEWSPIYQGPDGQNNQPTQFKFDASDLENDPGYQFQLQEGEKALQRSEAAAGTGTQGGAQLKALDRYNQDYASTAYNTAYQRAQGTFDQNLANAENQNNSNFNNGYTAASGNYQRASDAFANDYNRSQNEYATNANQFETDQANQWNRTASLAGIGQTATSEIGQEGADYANSVAQVNANAANNAANYSTQGANARAAGTIGVGNSITGAINGVGQIFGSRSANTNTMAGIGGQYDSNGYYIGDE